METVLINTRAIRAPYEASLQGLLSVAGGREARERLANWPLLSAHPTPAWSLPGLAKTLGVAGVTVKDESKRSSLGSFKALGAPNALIKLLQRRFANRAWSAADLFAGRHAEALRSFVVISATEDYRIHAPRLRDKGGTGCG